MAADPEFIAGDVLVPHAQAAGLILVDDRRQLFHFETLHVPATNLMDVSDDMLEVILAWMDDVVTRGHCVGPPIGLRCAVSGANVFSLGLAGLAVGGPGAMVGFFEGAVWLRHRKTPESNVVRKACYAERSAELYHANGCGSILMRCRRNRLKAGGLQEPWARGLAGPPHALRPATPAGSRGRLQKSSPPGIQAGHPPRPKSHRQAGRPPASWR